MSFSSNCISNFNIEYLHYLLESLDFNEALLRRFNQYATFCRPALPIEGADTGVQHPRPVNGSGMDVNGSCKEIQHNWQCVNMFLKISQAFQRNEQLHRFSRRLSTRCSPLDLYSNCLDGEECAFPGQKKVIARPTWMTRSRIQIINNYQQLTSSPFWTFASCNIFESWKCTAQPETVQHHSTALHISPCPPSLHVQFGQSDGHSSQQLPGAEKLWQVAKEVIFFLGGGIFGGMVMSIFGILIYSLSVCISMYSIYCIISL